MEIAQTTKDKPEPKVPKINEFLSSTVDEICDKMNIGNRAPTNDSPGIPRTTPYSDLCK